VTLVVDTFELGPIRTNCHVVRRAHGATEAAVLAPGANAPDLRPELAGISFETLRVPGHSPAHLAFYAEGCLFSGDVLFAGSVGRTDLPFADWATLVDSIRTLVERFPPETTVYSGHGPATTLGAELARNPFLAEVRSSLATQGHDA